MKNILDTTKSICPECKKEIKADIVQDSGSVFMEKHCLEHGFCRSLISKYSWYYQGLNLFYNELFPAGHIMNGKTIKIFQLYPTCRCNLDCAICFSGSSHSRTSENDLSLDEIKWMVKSIRGRKKIGILGGEPTVREDLTDIVRLFTRAGHEVYLYTNGLKLTDIKYARNLKQSGVKYLWTWIDTMHDEKIYKQMRGTELCNAKQRVLDNLKKIDMKTGIINVIVRDVNQDEISKVLDFARQNSFIAAVSIRGYSHLGKCQFPLSHEFVMDELVEIIENQTAGLVTLEEFFIFQKLTYLMRSLLPDQPQCYVCQYLYIPRKKEKRIRDIFPTKETNNMLDDFIEIHKRSFTRARIFFMKWLLKKIILHPYFFLEMILNKLIKGSHCSRHYLLLELAMFYTPHTLDLRKTKTRCTDAWLPAYARGEILDFCSMLSRGNQ